VITGALAFLVLLVLAVGAWEIQRLVGQRLLLLGGIGVLGLGVAAGSHGFGILPGGIVRHLHPVVLVGIAWLGLLYGLQVDLRVIRRLRPWHRWSGLLLPLAPAVLAGGTVLAGGGAPGRAVLVAAIAAIASPRIAELVLTGRPPADRSLVRLLRVVMAFSGIPAVALLATGAALVTDPGNAPFSGLLAALALGILGGYALVQLGSGERHEIRLMILLLGIVALAGGGAIATGQSPVLPAAIAGAIVINRTESHHRLLRAAHALESPLYVALLVLIGASWSPDRLDLVALTGLTIARAAGWLAAGAVLRRTAARNGVPLRTPAPGLGWLPQGPLAMGLLLAVSELLPSSGGLLEAGVLAIVLNHAAGHLWAARTLPAGATA